MQNILEKQNLRLAASSWIAAASEWHRTSVFCPEPSLGAAWKGIRPGGSCNLSV